jgi:crossover junction endodeoxyribonuclease RuvC
MKILGIDPGTARLGYGIIKTGPVLRYVDCGVIKPGMADHTLRLKILATRLDRVIDRHRPDRAAVEKLYFSTNKTTALAVAEARGVILLTLAKRRVPIWEFTPNQVKLLVAGWGRSDKRAVERAVRMTLNLPKSLRLVDDAADALALALCGAFVRRARG